MLNQWVLVLIPNGMEFYIKQGIDIDYGREVLIPNGMEFYFELNWKRGYLLVLIPNGMEFYLSPLCSINFLKNRFNSQRDGILPMDEPFSLEPATVLIPNGMEFYPLLCHLF